VLTSFVLTQALQPGAVPASFLQPGELELDHVVRVYDNIAIHWNHTRGKRKVIATTLVLSYQVNTGT
jgi:hypothetical protein